MKSLFLLGKHRQSRLQLRRFGQLLISLLACTFLFVQLGFNITAPQNFAYLPAAIAQVTDGDALLQRGIEFYRERKYAEAAIAWQEAASRFSVTEERLKQALALSNLSLAHQHLGQLKEAETAISEAVDLIRNADDFRDSRDELEVFAKVWNTQGRLLWARGQFEGALEAWQKASRKYAAANYSEGVVQTQINRAKALQAMGLSLQAEETLQEVDSFLKEQPGSDLKARGLQNLGMALRRLGDYSQSLEKLLASLELTETATTQRGVLVELGNTERALGNRALAIGNLEEGNARSERALSYYQQATAVAGGSKDALLPNLNQLRLEIELGRWSEAADLQASITPEIVNLPNGRTSVDAHLNFAQSLTCFKQVAELEDLDCLPSERRESLQQQLDEQRDSVTLPEWSAIEELLETAMDQSRSMGDPVAESYALGMLGRLKELERNWIEAESWTQQALMRLDTLPAPELRFRWAWQLGRLLEEAGDSKGAIRSYSAAVDALESVRGDLLTINPEVQFSFRDNAEPVYRKLVDLLLRDDATADAQLERLERAIEQIDALQLAELEDFLSCSLAQVVQLGRELEEIDSTAAFVFPIVLENRIATIVKLPEQPLQSFLIDVPQATVEDTIRRLRKAILGFNASQVIEKGGEMYRWLLEPLETVLAENPQIETLVFVLDGQLRNVPIGVLYDSENELYFAQKDYNIAVLPNSQLFDLRERSGQIEVLAGGIGKPLTVGARRFEALSTPEELKQFGESVPSTVLLDLDFTQANLQKNLESKKYSVVHLATHGKFSSDPEETFILVHSAESESGELLGPNDLDRLLGGIARSEGSAIDLLVLSACQTAEGDNRAVLGLAGLAVQAGARSTLATLWQVSDESTVKFMEVFYRELGNPGMTKAKALHRAQQSLIENAKFQNPFYWAPYLLVGNWQ